MKLHQNIIDIEQYVRQNKKILANTTLRIQMRYSEALETCMRQGESSLKTSIKRQERGLQPS